MSERPVEPECQIEHGQVTCFRCGHVYAAAGNCYPAPAPRGSGGCIHRCHCPACQTSCCAERDTPAPRYEPPSPSV